MQNGFWNHITHMILLDYDYECLSLYHFKAAACKGQANCNFTHLNVVDFPHKSDINRIYPPYRNQSRLTKVIKKIEWSKVQYLILKWSRSIRMKTLVLLIYIR